MDEEMNEENVTKVGIDFGHLRADRGFASTNHGNNRDRKDG